MGKLETMMKKILLLMTGLFVSLGCSTSNNQMTKVFYSGFDILRAFPVNEKTIENIGCAFTLDNFIISQYVIDEETPINYEPRDIALKIQSGELVYFVDRKAILFDGIKNRVFLKKKFLVDYDLELSKSCAMKYK